MKKYKENLESVNKTILIENKGIKITEDALILAEFIKKIIQNKASSHNWSFFDSKNMLEIGAGQGIISILLSEINFISKIYAVEIQNEIYNILIKNIKRNKLEEKIIAINSNIKEIKGEYDYIFSNPPYKKINSGRLPLKDSEKISKYEISLTLEELIFSIKKLLKNQGEFFLVIPEERMNDVFMYIYKNNLQIITMSINEYKKKKLILIHGKKGGVKKSGIKISYIKK